MQKFFTQCKRKKCFSPAATETAVNADCALLHFALNTPWLAQK